MLQKGKKKKHGGEEDLGEEAGKKRRLNLGVFREALEKSCLSPWGAPWEMLVFRVPCRVSPKAGVQVQRPWPEPLCGHGVVAGGQWGVFSIPPKETPLEEPTAQMSLFLGGWGFAAAGTSCSSPTKPLCSGHTSSRAREAIFRLVWGFPLLYGFLWI